jgi:hypothetical protein
MRPANAGGGMAFKMRRCGRGRFIEKAAVAGCLDDDAGSAVMRGVRDRPIHQKLLAHHAPDSAAVRQFAGKPTRDFSGPVFATQIVGVVKPYVDSHFCAPAVNIVQKTRIPRKGEAGCPSLGRCRSPGHAHRSRARTEHSHQTHLTESKL